MMKILFYSVNNMWIPHFETELELIQAHKLQGDEIFVLTCSGVLPRCTSNYEHAKTACLKCRSRFQVGMDRVAIPNSNIFTIKSFKPFPEIPKLFESIEQLEQFTVNGIEYGRMAASTIISELRDHKFDTVRYAQKVYKNLCTAIIAYHSAYSTLQKVKPDRVYIFNGRFSDVAPVVAACKKFGVEFYTHERGGVTDSYALFENTLPHDLVYNKNVMNALWNSEPNENKKQGASDWFVQRRAGAEQSWLSFIKGQVKGHLPEDFDVSKNNIAIFNSSFDEYIMFPEWQNPVYKDENTALIAILEHFKGDESRHFYLRVHPNLKGYERTQIKELEMIAISGYKNLTVIWPEEVIDSYALLEACGKTIVFASTIGVEACFWGKPVVLIGRAFYEDLNCCYVARSHDQAMKLIEQNDLKPKDKNSALPYAWWELKKGIPFKYFKPDGLFKGAFMGKEIKPQFGFKDKILFRIYDRLDRLAGKEG